MLQLDSGFFDRIYLFFGARAGCFDSLFAFPSGQAKELRQIETSLAQATLKPVADHASA